MENDEVIESCLALCCTALNVISSAHLLNKNLQNSLTLFVKLKGQFFNGKLLPRIEGFSSKLQNELTDDQFKRFFRMNRKTFAILQNWLEKTEEYQSTTRKFRDTVLITEVGIRYISTMGHSMTDIAMEFNISESTVHKYIQTFCDSVLNNLLNQLISWPNQSQMTKTIAAVQERSEIPNVIGFIDGTCIRTNAPKHFPQVYFCKKEVYAMQLLAVCQEDLLFTHVYTGWPGSCHDQRVLENDPFFYPENLETLFPNDTHLLGDSGYKCTNWVIAALKECQVYTEKQRKFQKKSKIKNEYRTCFWSFEGQIQATHVA